ncbi:MAG: hypothetical protein Hyperionvirus5_25 [Hyperionvirus sp.]|uniref:Sel1 repeat family protein n=1 Tax=Hyperionvirus sp. TaxID=2487770 RepID=A0A3G5ACY6_9VIRU|nr:MAG: hypothetical protein Hyperionvirus5_25 [Hyperionvirus sp.]
MEWKILKNNVSPIHIYLNITPWLPMSTESPDEPCFNQLQILIEKYMNASMEEILPKNENIMNSLKKLSDEDKIKLLAFLSEKSDNSYVAKLLGNFYENQSSLAESWKWYMKSAEMGDSFGMQNVGRYYSNGLFVKQDYHLAVEFFSKGADKKNPYCMSSIGDCYFYGRGVAISVEKALDWYLKAADARDITAIMSLGFMYANGKGVEKSFTEAMKWYLRGADLGNTPAMNEIGDIYNDGRWPDFPKNNEESMKWYLKSANLGSYCAMRAIGCKYYEGVDVAQDFKEAMKWYKMSNDIHESAILMLAIGGMYLLGQGVRKNVTEALVWYIRSAGLGNTKAMNRIGDLYYDGAGVDRDYIETLKWYRKAAALKDGEGMSNVGYMYSHGLGCEKNNTEALKWYTKAFDHKYVKASLYIADYYKGEDIKSDGGEVVRWYKKGAEAGYGEAMLQLGDIYQKGIYAEKNATFAIKWYEEAIKNKMYAGLTKIGDLYLEQKQIDSALKYYARSVEKITDRIEAEKLKLKITQLMKDHSFDLIHEWIVLVDKKILLEVENEKLKSEVLYQPCGDGFKDAEKHFILASGRIDKKIESAIP